MAQGQTKPRAEFLRRRNDDRTNGKAWKKKWGKNPPIEQSKLDSERSKEHGSGKKKVRKAKRRR